MFRLKQQAPRPWKMTPNPGGMLHYDKVLRQGGQETGQHPTGIA